LYRSICRAILCDIIEIVWAKNVAGPAPLVRRCLYRYGHDRQARRPRRKETQHPLGAVFTVKHERQATPGPYELPSAAVDLACRRAIQEERARTRRGNQM
jgi:hypothetical protein